MNSTSNASSNDAAQAWLGRLLRGKWRLSKLLGTGGMSWVYEGIHRNGNRVAIKLLKPTLGSHAQVRARFLREGYLANRVAHPGAVRVLDDDTTEEGVPFLVMELLQGETLAERLTHASRPPDFTEIIELGARVLDVLAAAHQRGVVHRDIKPENIFVTAEREVKLLDFGVAHLDDATELESGTGWTRKGTALGTPAFMAPEQARGYSDTVDARADVWSVGALLFMMTTGRRVHEGATSNELMIAAATMPARPVRDLAPQLPIPLAHVIDRALQLEPAQRWLDAGAMLAALRTAWESESNGAWLATWTASAPLDARGADSTRAEETRPLPTPSTQLLGPSKGRRRWWPFAGGLVVALIVVGLLWVRSIVQEAEGGHLSESRTKAAREAPENLGPATPTPESLPDMAGAAPVAFGPRDGGVATEAMVPKQVPATSRRPSPKAKPVQPRSGTRPSPSVGNDLLDRWH